MVDLDEITRSAQDIEPLQATATRIATLVGRDDWDRKELDEIVNFDAPLAMHVLRLANSAAYGGRTEIRKVADATVRLGASKVLSLAMSFELRGRMDRGIPEYGLGPGQLWRHSVAASLVPESFGRVCEVRAPVGTETAALLHDVGKLVLCRFLEKPLLEAVGRAGAGDGAMHEAERLLLGVDHAEIGGIVAQNWHLPYAIVEPILHHHRPAAQHGIGCDVVHLANVVAKACVADPPEDNFLERVDPGVRERCDLTDERFVKLTGAVAAKLDEVMSHYS